MQGSHSHDTYPASQMLPLRRGKSHYHLRPDTPVQARLMKRQHTRRSRRWWRTTVRQAWQEADPARRDSVSAKETPRC
jgi:hypothetical protein